MSITGRTVRMSSDCWFCNWSTKSVRTEARTWYRSAPWEQDELAGWVARFCGDHRIVWCAELLNLEEAL